MRTGSMNSNQARPADPGPGGAAPRVGMFPPGNMLGFSPDTEATRRFLAGASAAGLDHVCVGDHVSFGGGAGFDGLLQAAVLAALHPSLPVYTGVYLLPLRHPVLVARQIADLGQLAPGRLIFGVGVGGEDRHEVAVCGVDPATRGRRMNESLTALRALLTGQPASCYGEFFGFEDAVIAPAPPRVPIIVGGRSDAAIRRAGRLGDGWLGIWNSPRRFAAAVQLAADEAGRAGRTDPPRRHGMQVWCGLAGSREQARGLLAPAMEGFYGLPFARFEKYCPYGSPADVAEFLAGYAAEGCAEFNLIPQAPDADEAVAAVAEVKRLLAGTMAAVPAPVRAPAPAEQEVAAAAR
jgi:alkanesulfonate monooxygenase SsuD/methylene tetrahydromethanopterin reductase-like flavin-dependent oxidoreductase (luciferase family)